MLSEHDPTMGDIALLLASLAFKSWPYLSMTVGILMITGWQGNNTLSGKTYTMIGVALLGLGLGFLVPRFVP